MGDEYQVVKKDEVNPKKNIPSSIKSHMRYQLSHPGCLSTGFRTLISSGKKGDLEEKTKNSTGHNSIQEG